MSVSRKSASARSLHINGLIINWYDSEEEMAKSRMYGLPNFLYASDSALDPSLVASLSSTLSAIFSISPIIVATMRKHVCHPLN